jgi:hypothetical protein
MSTMRVDFLFRGSHPAFYWAAALLKQKGKSVAIYSEPELHSWELFPQEVLSLLGLEKSTTDRDQNPIQILTTQFRFGIYSNLDFTKKEKSFCVGEKAAPELNRGLSFFAKGSDYPVVFGDNTDELIEATHRMEYFEVPPHEVKLKVTTHLKKMGVEIYENDRDLPIAEQTVILDLSRAEIFRTKFEITVPLSKLPVGASNRMLFVQRNSPLIEMIHFNETLHLKTLLPNDPALIERMLLTIAPYFLGSKFSHSSVTIVPEVISHHEWVGLKSPVDSSKIGTWLVSPAISPELGERSLYIRISELLRLKFKKQPIFENTELFQA